MACSQTPQKGPITSPGPILDLKTGKCLIHPLMGPPHNIKHYRPAFSHNQDPQRTILGRFAPDSFSTLAASTRALPNACQP